MTILLLPILIFSMVLTLFLANAPILAIEVIYWLICLKNIPEVKTKAIGLALLAWLIRLPIFIALLYLLLNLFDDPAPQKSGLTFTLSFGVFLVPHLVSALFMWLKLTKFAPDKSTTFLVLSLVINVITYLSSWGVVTLISQACLNAGGC